MKKSIKITFYKIKDNSSKVKWICQQAIEAMELEKKLLISVPSLQAGHYLDELLWRMPEESFIPHVVTDMPTSEWIAITLQEEVNVNGAARILNLCPQPSKLYSQMEEVREIYDETDANRMELSRARVLFYEKQGLLVNFISF